MPNLLSKFSGSDNQSINFYLRISLISFAALSAATIWAASPVRADGYVSVLTQHNDNRRSGANLNETVLSPANVNIYHFGKQYSRQVDGQIYAQPLIVPNVNIPGKAVHNIVIIATMHDSVYAFDADDNIGSNANPLWQVSFTNSALGISSVPVTAFYSGDIKYEVGVLSTPVVDPISRTIYLVSWTLERTKTAQNLVYRIHALSISDGSEKFGGPVVIQGSVPGTGDSNDGNGNVVFVPRMHLQRPALLLLNDVVYVSFGSHTDARPYHGWIMGYSANSLQQVSIACTTPRGWGGSFWQAGQGPAADDDGNIYVMTSNGSVDYSNLDYSMSILKLSPDLQILDFFMPYNAFKLSASDYDLGSAGVMVMPGGNRVVGGGKQGKINVVDTSNLGQFNGVTDNTIQTFQVPGTHIHGTPIWWQSTNGDFLYVWSEQGNVNAYRHNQDLFTRSAISKIIAPIGMPGGFLSITSNGADASTGVVWANIRVDANAPAQGVMRAFDARDLKELWNSEMNPDRDRTGLFAKFVPPTVANGKVYFATFSNAMQVYGPKLLTHTPVISPGPTQFNPVIQVSIADDQAGAEIHYTLDGTAPTRSSSVYAGPFTLTSTTVVKARAFLADYDDSIVATTTFTSGSSLNLSAIADAFVRGGSYTSINYGTGLLTVQKSTNVKISSANRASYLQFDLTNITSAPTAASLKLYIDPTSTPVNSTAHISCYGLPGASWIENSINYNNAPGLNTVALTSTGVFASSRNVPLAVGSVSFDVTSFITSHLGQVVTLQLIDEQPESILLALKSRESNNSQPALALTW